MVTAHHRDLGRVLPQREDFLELLLRVLELPLDRLRLAERVVFAVDQLGVDVLDGLDDVNLRKVGGDFAQPLRRLPSLRNERRTVDPQVAEGEPCDGGVEGGVGQDVAPVRTMIAGTLGRMQPRCQR